MPELFYRMKYAKTDSSYYDRNLVPRSQVEIVKAVSDYITKNLNGKITVKELTSKFGVSDTYLQNAFRNVYGMPVISFIRVQKMQSAAQVLIHTSATIDEIAEEFGYENESKFSAAFKKIMGDSPGVYRKEHSKVKII
jgi:AraC-like DNA-binding protein